MHDQPTTTELIRAVRDFIQNEAESELKGRKLFLSRVAANALDIVARQIESESEQNARELERLHQLLGHEGTLDELNRELCVKIRGGEIASTDSQLIAHLRATTMDKLSVDQPKYSTYQAELRRS